MNKISEAESKVRHEKRKQMYEEYKSSGMKVCDWCENHGLSVKTFYYRLRVIREDILRKDNEHDIVPVILCSNEIRAC